MLTFVLLYIIIITKLGVITPTYVYTHMFLSTRYYVLVDFVESNMLSSRKKWAFIVHFTSLVVRWSPHKFAHFFLFGVLTMFSFCVSSQVSIPKKGEKTAVLSRHALVVLGKLLFICFAIQLFLLSSKKNNQIILVISVCKDDFDWLHSRQNNYIFRHSVCIKKRTYFVRFSFYLCLFFVISYFPLLQLL